MIRKILLVVTLLVGCLLFLGATTPNSFVSPQIPNRGVVQFLQGTDSAGVYKTLYTAGSNGSRCYGMWATNNDGSATHLITVQLVNGTVKYGGPSITTISNSGFSGTVPPQAIMNSVVWPGLPVDQYGNPYLQLVTGDTIQATYATSLTTSDLINIVTSCSDF